MWSYKFKQTGVFSFFAFAVPFLLIFNAIQNIWYVSGSGLLDHGWFSFLSSHASFPTVKSPAVLGGESFFSTHMSPIFIVYSTIRPLFGSISDHAYFAVCQSFWFGLLGLLTYLFARRKVLNPFICLVLGLLGGLNGIALVIADFPHIEIAIPVLLVAFLYLMTQEKHSWMKLSIVGALLLSVREDAGLHAFGLFFGLVCASVLRRESAYVIRRYALAGTLLCVGSLLLIFTQKIFYSVGDNALRRIYIGAGFYDHVTWPFLWERIGFLFTHRKYFFWPLLVLCGISLWRRDHLLAVGAWTTFPWVLFSLLAIAPQAGNMNLYYAFPMMIVLLWPMISASMVDKKKMYFWVIVQIVFCAFSMRFAPGKISVGFEYLQRAAPMNRAMASIAANKEELGKYAFGEAVAAFLVEELKPNEWRFLNRFQAEDRNLDTVMFWRDRQADAMEWLQGTPFFSYRYEIEDTPILVFSKKELSSVLSGIGLQEYDPHKRSSCRLSGDIGTNLEIEKDVCIRTNSWREGLLTRWHWLAVLPGVYRWRIVYRSEGERGSLVGKWHMTARDQNGKETMTADGEVFGSLDAQTEIDGEWVVSEEDGPQKIFWDIHGIGGQSISLFELEVRPEWDRLDGKPSLLGL